MLSWIFILMGLCAVSATLGLGHVVPLASFIQGLLLTLTAVSAMGLFAAFDAFETQSATVASDEDD